MPAQSTAFVLELQDLGISARDWAEAREGGRDQAEFMLAHDLEELIEDAIDSGAVRLTGLTDLRTLFDIIETARSYWPLV